MQISPAILPLGPARETTTSPFTSAQILFYRCLLKQQLFRTFITHITRSLASNPSATVLSHSILFQFFIDSAHEVGFAQCLFLSFFSLLLNLIRFNLFFFSMTSVRKQNEAPLVQEKGREKAPYRLGMEAITSSLKKQLQFILQARNILKPVIKILLLVLMVIILLRDLIHENHPQSTPIGG
ncbi:MAG: hypothetical protein FD188_3597, partial [Ignavibacteria bacterium]